MKNKIFLFLIILLFIFPLSVEASQIITGVNCIYTTDDYYTNRTLTGEASITITASESGLSISPTSVYKKALTGSSILTITTEDTVSLSTFYDSDTDNYSCPPTLYAIDSAFNGLFQLSITTKSTYGISNNSVLSLENTYYKYSEVKDEEDISSNDSTDINDETEEYIECTYTLGILYIYQDTGATRFIHGDGTEYTTSFGKADISNLCPIKLYIRNSTVYLKKSDSTATYIETTIALAAVESDNTEDETTSEIDLDISGICTTGYIPNVLYFLGVIIYIAKIVVPILIIGFASFDLFQVITSGKDDEIKKRGGIIVKRIAMGAIIFLIPTILNFVFLSINSDYEETKSAFYNCYTCLLEPSNCEK